MRLDLGRRPFLAGLALLSLVILAGLSAPAVHAQDNPTPPSAAEPTPSTKPEATTPQTEKPDAGTPAKPGTAEPEATLPGVTTDAAATPVDIPSRPTVFVHGKATWAEGFASLVNAQKKVRDAMDKAGLKQGGHPITVFTETDDTSFTYDAMLPLAEKPADNVSLAEDVKLGLSPSGKAIKFQHRGAYDDIASTYDLITAYLDEKGLEAGNFFVEEYLTDLKASDDPNLAVDIYVFLK